MPMKVPDPSLPNFMVTVEPFQTAAQDIRSGGADSPQPLDDRLGIGVATQLLSTLSRVGNISVIDHETYRSNPDRWPNIYLIKGVITEYAETNEAAEQKKDFSLGPIGQIANTVGNAVGSRVLSLAGVVAVQAGVSSEQTAGQRKGSVGLDIQVIGAGNGQILSSFPCQGTFVTQSATKANTALGFGMSSSAYQSSAIGQAQRAALNDAATQISSALRMRGRR